MKNSIRFQKINHGSVLAVDSSNPNFVEISMHDSDNPLFFHDVCLSRFEVDELIDFLEAWKNKVPPRCHVSANEKFSWFNEKKRNDYSENW